MRAAECLSSCLHHLIFMIIELYKDWLQIGCSSGAVARLILCATVSAVTGICFPKTGFLRRNNSFGYLFLTDILVRHVHLYICFSESDIQTRLYFLCLYQGTVVCACVLFVGTYRYVSLRASLAHITGPHE